jgi:hypothetical protein
MVQIKRMVAGAGVHAGIAMLAYHSIQVIRRPAP